MSTSALQLRAPLAARILLLALFAFATTLALRTPTTLRFPLFGDGHYYFLQLHSLAFDHDLALDNQRALLGDPLGELQRDVTRGLGNSLLWAPFFAVGAGVGALASDDAKTIALYAAWACRAGTLFYVLLAGFLAYGLRSLARVPRSIRGAALVLLWLGTPLWHFTFTLPIYNHGLTFFLATCLLRACDDELSQAAWSLRRLSLLLALCLLTRPELALLALPLMAACLPRLTPDVAQRRARARTLALAALLAALALALQLVMFASAGLPALKAGFLQPGDPWLLDAWFGPRNGFFAQQPLLFFAMGGLLVSVRRPERALACVAIFAFGFVQASAWDVWGGFGFGARRFVPLLPYAYVGLCELADAVRARPRWVALALAVLVLASGGHGWHALGLPRAKAIDTSTALHEDAYLRAMGVATSLPQLAARALEADASLHDAYRIAWHAVLSLPLGTHDKVDLLRQGTLRERALRVPPTQAGATHAWVLPVGRTALCGLGAAVGRAPRALWLAGRALAPAADLGGFRLFPLQSPVRSRWVRLEAQLSAPPPDWALDSRCALYR